MGMRADLIRRMAPAVRRILYNDGNYCKNVETHKFDRYIADNPANVGVLENAMNSKGITLVISPTGSGKSSTLANVAEKVVKQDKNCKVFITVPTVGITEQMGNIPFVRPMFGGDRFNPQKQITVTSYEKLADVQEYIRIQKAYGNKERYVLIMDECHFLVTQHFFREGAMKRIISSIEENLYDSAMFLTATPAPMPLFRFDRCLEFESDSYRPVMDRIEIEFVDDVIQYVKDINPDECFPFVRLNNTETIYNLVDNDLPSYAVFTSDRKDNDMYSSIVSHETISNATYRGLLCTSVSEVGINITSYPSDMQMIAVFPDRHMNVDSIEQFFNRARRTATSHIECAKVILPKPKENTACLLDGNGNELCEFEDVVLHGDTVTINDTAKMDSLAYGTYQMEIRLYGGKKVRNLYIQSMQDSGEGIYCKDSQPVSFSGVGFRPMLDIFKSDCNKAKCVKDTLQKYLNAFEMVRNEKQALQNLTDDEMHDLEMDDQKLIDVMTVAGIESQKELKECLKYMNGKLTIDYRILYMASYDKYQKQYLYHADRLKEELENRMKVPVTFVETDTAKGKREYNRNNLWEGIENIRQQVFCDEAYYNALTRCENNKYTQNAPHKYNITKIRENGYHLIELMRDLKKYQMSEENILRVLVSSRTRARVTKYKNAYLMVKANQVLDKFDGKSVGAVPLYNKGVQDTVQVAVYCCLKQKGRGSYSITDALAEEIIAFHRKAFSSDKKAPQIKDTPAMVKKVKNMMTNMYQTKGSGYIYNRLKTNENDIFKMVNADY